MVKERLHRREGIVDDLSVKCICKNGERNLVVLTKPISVVREAKAQIWHDAWVPSTVVRHVTNLADRQLDGNAQELSRCIPGCSFSCVNTRVIVQDYQPE